MQYLLYSEKTSKPFPSLTEMFQHLSGEGYIINSSQDGILETNKGQLSFTKIETVGLSDSLKSEIDQYRVELRESVALLKKQGIPVDNSQLTLIKQQFEFLNTTPGETSVPEETKNEVPETTEESPVTTEESAPESEETEKAGKKRQKKEPDPEETTPPQEDELPFS